MMCSLYDFFKFKYAEKKRLEAMNGKVKYAIGSFVFYNLFKLDRDADAAKIVLRKLINTQHMERHEI